MLLNKHNWLHFSHDHLARKSHTPFCHHKKFDHTKTTMVLLLQQHLVRHNTVKHAGYTSCATRAASTSAAPMLLIKARRHRPAVRTAAAASSSQQHSHKCCNSCCHYSSSRSTSNTSNLSATTTTAATITAASLAWPAIASAAAETAATAAAAAAGPVDAATYVPGPFEPGWQVYFGAFIGVVPFAIGAYEFTKRIVRGVWVWGVGGILCVLKSLGALLNDNLFCAHGGILLRGARMLAQDHAKHTATAPCTTQTPKQTQQTTPHTSHNNNNYNNRTTTADPAAVPGVPGVGPRRGGADRAPAQVPRVRRHVPVGVVAHVSERGGAARQRRPAHAAARPGVGVLHGAAAAAAGGRDVDSGLFGCGGSAAASATTSVGGLVAAAVVCSSGAKGLSCLQAR
jgi:hypothetical protein